MLCWIFLVVILFIFLTMISMPAHECLDLNSSAHSEQFRMIPTDETATAYVPEKQDGEIVFRPVMFSEETTAPQRVDRRYSTPMDIRSSPPSAYVKPF